MEFCPEGGKKGKGGKQTTTGVGRGTTGQSGLKCGDHSDCREQRRKKEKKKRGRIKEEKRGRKKKREKGKREEGKKKGGREY